MDVVDRLGRQRSAVAAAMCEQFVVHAVEMFGAQTCEPVGTDRRGDLVVGVPLVSACGRWAQFVLASGQPHLEQELFDRQCRCGSVAKPVSFGAEPRRHRFGIGPTPTGGMPSPSFLSGARIVAVVGDDVEAVVAQFESWADRRGYHRAVSKRWVCVLIGHRYTAEQRAATPEPVKVRVCGRCGREGPWSERVSRSGDFAASAGHFPAGSDGADT